MFDSYKQIVIFSSIAAAVLTLLWIVISKGVLEWLEKRWKGMIVLIWILIFATYLGFNLFATKQDGEQQKSYIEHYLDRYYNGRTNNYLSLAV